MSDSKTNFADLLRATAKILGDEASLLSSVADEIDRLYAKEKAGDDMRTAILSSKTLDDNLINAAVVYRKAGTPEKEVCEEPMEVEESQSSPLKGILSFGDVSLDEITCAIQGPLGTRLITPVETNILHFLFTQKGKVIEKDTLKQGAFGRLSSVDDHTLHRKLFVLQQNLNAVSDQVTIETKQGVGFFLKINQ